MDNSDDNPWGAPTPSPGLDSKPPSFPIVEDLNSTPEEAEEVKVETSLIKINKFKEPIEAKLDDISTGEAREDRVEEVVEEGEFTERVEEPVVSRRESISVELPPMDEFPPSSPLAIESTSLNFPDSIPESTIKSEVVVTEEDDDGFDDFADFGEGGDEGDDFGSFGGDEDEFSLPPLSSFSTSNNDFVQNVPIASTSTTKYSTLDLSKPTVEGLRSQLTPFLDRIYPTSSNNLSDEHERQVDGVAQVLVTEGLRSLLVNLSSLPALKPLDWRRSRIRREHLITLGVPINLDDSPDAKPLASLILPSQIKRSASPAPRSSLAASPSISTNTNRPFTTSPLPSRSSTPNPSQSSPSSYARTPINPSPVPPPLDTVRAREICDYQELDLSLFSLEKLRLLKEEMEGFNQSVSIRLQFELGVREREVGDGETYHAMIQDLVSAASKMKTNGRGTTVSRSGSSSGWTRKTSK